MTDETAFLNMVSGQYIKFQYNGPKSVTMNVARLLIKSTNKKGEWYVTGIPVAVKKISGEIGSTGQIKEVPTVRWLAKNVSNPLRVKKIPGRETNNTNSYMRL